MAVYALALLAGLVFITLFADRFVLGSSEIARNLGVAPLIIGITIVGFGTSAPEMLVSAFAAWQGNSGIAIGNALGSNIANIGLILGLTALLAPIMVHSKTLRLELPFLLLVTGACYGLAWFGGLTRIDSLIMITGLFVYVYWLVKTAVANRDTDPLSQEIESEIPTGLTLRGAWFWCVIGLIGLLISSRILVWSAVGIAQGFGVSDLIIGLSIVAIGTSLPELAVSIASIKKHQDDLAIGNIIGSNMYNLLAVFALPGFIAPQTLEADVLYRDFPWVIALTAALFVCAFGVGRGFNGDNGRISRIQGGIFLGAYIIYQSVLFQDALSTR